jgi:hypothetical protein
MKTKRKWFSIKLAALTVVPFSITSALGLVSSDVPITSSWLALHALILVVLILLNVVCADFYDR